MSSASSTKQRILGIARELFARQGYTGTSIADIARELGTSTAALYYHFPSKADILRALIAEPLGAYTRLLGSLQERQPARPGNCSARSSTSPPIPASWPPSSTATRPSWR